MKQIKTKRGITLVALIITIIVLLILAGIVINMTLGNDGIITKAQGAADAYKNAQEQEENMLNTMLGYMGGATSTGSPNGQTGDLNGQTGTGNASFRPCTISISDKGLITVSGVSNMKQFTISVDNKCIGVTEESTYKLSTEIGKKVTVYIVAIDEDMNLYKSNEQDYTATGLFLYAGNAVVNGTTTGFTLTPDNRFYYSKFPDSLNSIHAVREQVTCGGWGISTNKPIDLTGYSKICCIYSTSSDTVGSGQTTKLGLYDSKNTLCSATEDGTSIYSSGFAIGVTNQLLEWTIPDSSKNKSYYIGMGAGEQKDTYIHAIWLE